MHPNKSVNTYKHSLAAYPIRWKTYVVSPQKICIQFEDVQCKTRVKIGETQDLRSTPLGHKEMGINTRGTTIDTLAVGIPLRLYPDLLKNILQAIEEHSINYPEHSLKDFMLKYSQDIQETFNGQ